MKKFNLYIFIIVIFVGFLSIIPKNKYIYSIPSTSVKDTLTSSQLSYFARIGSGTTMGDSLVKINTAANPSKTTNNLFEGDTICIANNGGSGCTQYSVTDVGNTAYFGINSTLSAATAYVTNYIIATRSARHIVTFTPQSSVIAGKWQFLLKIGDTSSDKFKDGIPDQDGFDIGATAVGGTGPGALLRAQDVTCPFGIGTSATGIGSTVGITAANGTTYYYHTIICSLAAGTGNPIGVGASWYIGGASVADSSQISNPTPNRTVDPEGTANVFNFFIRHTDSAGIVIDGDTARGQIAVVESVRVTATVDPTISFVIDNVGTTNVGTSVCAGAVLGANAASVTATQVPFGSLQLQAFNNLAQRVSATTNATYGYAVTVYEDAPLTMVGGAVTIPDTTCDAGTCNTTTAGTWNNATLTPSKFGYTLTAVPAAPPSTMAFTTGTNQYKPFGIGYANAVNIFSNSAAPSTWERSYVCYRLAVTNTQAAGNYENKIVYTATATF